MIKPVEIDFQTVEQYAYALEKYVEYLEANSLTGNQAGIPLGEGEVETVYQARIATCGAKVVGDGKYNQFRFAGALISPVGQTPLSESGDWEGIVCEVIVRPIQRMGHPKIQSMRLDQVAQVLGDNSQWEKKKNV